MSVKKDETGRRWVQAEVEVPGTPEQVWQAIATGSGVSSWFVPTEAREDGTVVSSFGSGMEVVAKQTAWNPPHNFAAESELGPGAPKMATEWIVEALSGDRCIVRVVHSLFASSEDWDDQLESIEKGWPDYFQLLRLYLTHFSGMPSTMFQLMGITAEPAETAWGKVVDSLGLTPIHEGGPVRTTSATNPQLSGIVERTGQPGHPNQLVLRIDQPTSGLAHLFAMEMAGMVFLSVRVYLYGDQASAVAAVQEPAWRSWMNELFPSTEQAVPTC